MNLFLQYNFIFNKTNVFNFIFDDKFFFFSILITVIFTFTFFFSYFYMYFDKKNYKFLFFLTWFAFSMIYLTISNNLLLAFLCWEFIGLSSFFLIGFYNNKVSSFKSALKALFFNKFSDSLFVIVCMLYYYINNTFLIRDMDCLNSIIYKQDFFFFKMDLRLAFIILLTILCSIKSAQFVFSVWLIDSMDAPVPASALIHSSTLVMAGIFILYKFKYLFFIYSYFSTLCIIIFLFTALFSCINASMQTDLKKILAYSTISNCSLILISLLLCSESYFLYYVILHGFFKSSCFLSVGVLFLINKHCQDNRFFNYKKLTNSIYYLIGFLFILLSSAPITIIFDIKHSIILNNVFYYESFIIILFFMLTLISVFSFFYSFNFILRFINYNKCNKKYNSPDTINLKKNIMYCIFVLSIFIIFYTVFFVFFNYSLFLQPSYGYFYSFDFFYKNVFILKIYSFLLFIIFFFMHSNMSRTKKSKITLLFFLFFFFLI